MTELLLGIDIGSSGSKGVLATPDGRLVASAERAHELSLPQPGWVEHDAETVWWADFVALCRELVERAPAPPAAVCVSGIGPCLLAADAAGRPLRPAILYGIDTRATAEIAELTARYGEDEIVRRGGSPLTTQAIGPKLLWLQRNEPDVWARTERMLMASSFVVHRLTGEYVLDHHSASQCDPLYDLAAGRWIGDWADDIAPGLALPRLVWPGEIAGTVTSAAAAVTGLAAGTPVAAGTIDAWAEAESVGVRAPGDTMLMYGTTMFIVAVLAEPRSHPRLWATNGIRPGTPTLAAGMATSGALTGWLRAIAGDPPFEQLVAEAAAVEPGSGGLVVLPYFAGERTPLFDPAARGTILGLTLSHGRGHLYRALLEATAYGVRHNLEAMGEAAERLVAVGGGTKGGLWTQIVSDVTRRPQELPAETVGAALGDARLAGEAAGLVDGPWNPVAATVEPDPAAGETYDELYGIYRDLYPATREQAHALAAIQQRAASLVATFLLLVVAGLALVPAARAGEDSPQLLGWETYRQLDRLPELPSGARALQFSSFDRTGANDDGFSGRFSCLRRSADGCVIAEADGPGEVEAIWFTANIADPGHLGTLGDLTIELDGRTVVDAPLQDVVSGALGPPFVFPLVADRERSSGGSYIKVPMPFRESMRITTENTAQFLHVNYRRFADADGVRTFDPSDRALDVIARLRAAGERDPKPPVRGARTERASVAVPPGSARTLARLRGPGTISELAVRVPQLVGPSVQPLIADDGRGFRDGSSTFTVAVDPRNDGVRLTRRIDTYWPNSQEAVVAVDGVEAGRWPTVPTTLGPRWVDVSVDLPAALTAGKSRLELHTRSLPTLFGAVQEFTYWVDSRVGGEYVRTDELDVGAASEEAAHGYRIESQTWSGTTRAKYAPTGDREAIAASDEVLAGARLRIAFDGRRTVDAPLGEFFGSGLGEAPVRALMFAMDTADDGWYRAWWPMPYRRSAVVELVNESGRPIGAADARVTWARGSDRDAGYFHATSRRGPVEPGRDWTVLDAVGQGKLVGVVQTMHGKQADSLTQRGYLEGDERVHVDGSRSPQLHGTGTEDFYEGAWYFAYDTFSNPQNGNTGFELQELGCAHVCDGVYRLLLADAVPFARSLHFGIEHGMANEWPADYGSTAFWYGRAEPALAPADAVDVGDAASERAHDYRGGGERVELTSVFEGDRDDEPVTEDGRATTDPVTFEVSVDRSNGGIVLRRLSDQREGYQAVRVYVDSRRAHRSSGGSFAGLWRQPLANPFQRWLEDDFQLPPELTAGRRALRITLVPVNGAPAWHAARYEALELTR